MLLDAPRRAAASPRTHLALSLASSLPRSQLARLRLYMLSPLSHSQQHPVRRAPPSDSPNPASPSQARACDDAGSAGAGRRDRIGEDGDVLMLTDGARSGLVFRAKRGIAAWRVVA